jgi:hypothetical protein
MTISFDHSANFIVIPQSDAAPLMMQTLINAIRDEESSERGIVYDQIADATGKNALGGGVQTGITVALRSSWKLNFAAGAYQATVSGGNLADALDRINNTGNPQVLVQSSAAATLVIGDGGAPPTAAQNAAAVIAAAQATPIAADIRKVNAVPITGSGIEGTDEWRPM